MGEEAGHGGITGVHRMSEQERWPNQPTHSGNDGSYEPSCRPWANPSSSPSVLSRIIWSCEIWYGLSAGALRLMSVVHYPDAMKLTLRRQKCLPATPTTQRPRVPTPRHPHPHLPLQNLVLRSGHSPRSSPSTVIFPDSPSPRKRRLLGPKDSLTTFYMLPSSWSMSVVLVPVQHTMHVLLWKGSANLRIRGMLQA